MDLKILCHTTLIALCLPAFTAQAAELNGRTWYEQGKRPAANVQIVLDCHGFERFRSHSDRYGFYRLSGLPPRQSCYLFIIDGARQSAPLTFYTGQGREVLNFALSPAGDAQLIVKKR